MTDTYTADDTPDISPEDFIRREQRSAVSSVYDSFDQDPERAARAQRLSQDTGDNPAVVNYDLDNYERQHRAALSSQLIQSNSYIREYLNSHPLAADISNDDLGYLDQVSERLHKLIGNNDKLVGEGKLSVANPIATAVAAYHGFQENYGNEPYGLWITPEDVEVMHKYNLTHLAGMIDIPVEAFMRTFNGVLGAIGAGSAEMFRQGTGANDQEAQRFGQAMRGMAELHLMGVSGVPHAGGGEPMLQPGEFRMPRLSQIPPEQAMAVARTIKNVKPWVDAGIEPPVGVDPHVDLAKKAQAEADAQNLDDAFDAATQSKTRERSPEMFASFIRQKTDATVGITADAVRELYGDKVPTTDDGLLGWIPGLAERLRVAEETGGDVEVPLADFLAKTEPEVWSKLHDDVRVHEGGMTLNEAKEVKPPEPKQPIEEVRPEALTEMAEQLPSDPTQRLYDAYKALKEKQKGIVDASTLIKEAGVSPEDFAGWMASAPEGVRELRSTYSKEPKAMANRLVVGDKDFYGITFDREPSISERAEQPPQPLPLDEVRKSAGLLPKRSEAAIPISQTSTMITPKKVWRDREVQIMNAVDEVLSRVLPKVSQEQVIPARRLVADDNRLVRGYYTAFTDKLPLIFFSMEGSEGPHSLSDVVKTARHEAIHYLRNEGFFTPEEWRTLVNAAVDNGWIEKHGIKDRYKGQKLSQMLEEAIADEFKEWERKPEVEHPASGPFAKLRELFTSMKEALSRVFGETEPLTHTELFEKIESGEIGSREGTQPIDPRAFKQMLEEAKEGPDIFDKASAAGMTVKQYRKYQKLISNLAKEDEQAQIDKASKDIRLRQTEAWKGQEKIVRAEVERDIEKRPDLAADALFREGKFRGQQLGEVPKLQRDKVPEALRDSLKDFLAKDGLKPDDIAGEFGFQTGEGMLNRLAILQEARKQTRLKPDDYINRVVSEETDRRMKKKMGDLEENVLAEAKEHVLSQTQMDMIHEELLAAGMKAGQQLPFTKEKMAANAKADFANEKAEGATSARYMASAAKAASKAEVVDREGKVTEPVDALKAKEQQAMSLYMAKEAVKFEKEKAKAEKLFKRLGQREIKGLPLEYTNQLHWLLSKIGLPFRKGAMDPTADLFAAIGREEHSNITDFVQAKADHHQLPLAFDDIVYDDNWHKSYEDLTVQEFRSINQAIKTLNALGRLEKKAIVAGEQVDLDTHIARLSVQLDEHPVKAKPVKLNKSRFRNLVDDLQTIGYKLVQMETIWNKFDLGDKYGLFNNTFSYAASEAANNFSVHVRKFSKELAALPKVADLDKRVENTIWRRPSNGELYDLTRENVVAMLRNVGNRQQLEKLALGYGIHPEVALEWLRQNATEDMWNFVTAEGKVFEKAYRLGERMIHTMGATPPEKIPLDLVRTPFGVKEGWYHPIVYDNVEWQKSKALQDAPDPSGVFEDSGYYRASTPKGWTRARTGYIGPIYLKMDRSAGRLTSILKDVAFRPFIANMSKFVYNGDFMNAVLRNMGQNVRDMHKTYLEDIAGVGNRLSTDDQIASSWLEYARRNLISTYIAYNVHTIAKHTVSAAINSMGEVGLKNFWREFASMRTARDVDPEGKLTNWEWAMQNVPELQRRAQHFIETIGGQYETVRGETNLRERLAEKGAAVISFMDLVSNVPTWIAEYKTSMKELAEQHPDQLPEQYHGTAMEIAQRANRRAHGSTAITSRPSAMRGGAMARTFTSLYGFFNQMMQRHYEVAWRAKYGMNKDVEMGERLEQIPKIALLLTTSVLAVGTVEELVTPYTNADHDSPGRRIAKAMLMGASGSYPIVREFVHGIINNWETGPGMIDSAMKELGKGVSALKHYDTAFSAERGGKTIKDLNTLIGMSIGFTNNEFGNIMKTIWDSTHKSKESPKDFKEFMSDLTTGKARRTK